MTTTRTKKKSAIADLIVPIAEEKSRAGAPVKEKPNMRRLAENWASVPVGATIPLPDADEEHNHNGISKSRHHFKKYASEHGLEAGNDYRISLHSTVGIVIKRLR